MATPPHIVRCSSGSAGICAATIEDGSRAGRRVFEAEDLLQGALLAIHTRRHTYDRAERRQRAQQNIAHQREVVMVLEQGGHDFSIASAVLKMFEIALALHVTDRDWLVKELEESS